MKNTGITFLKNRRFIFLVYAILSLLYVEVYAQSSSTDNGWHTSFVPSLSSVPASILNGDLVHESLFNGTLNVSIPIHTLSSNTLEVPVLLNYNTGGILVQEQASRVGLGWQLSAGGMIKREVKGTPDDSYNIVNGSASPNGLLSQPYNISDPSIFIHHYTYPLSNGTLTEDLALSNSVLTNCYEKQYDGEPDIYHFDFNGNSGKIIFDVNKIPHIISKQNIKVSVSYVIPSNQMAFSNYTKNQIDQWTLTTGNGVQYIFKTKEYINYRSSAVIDYAASYYYNPATSSIMSWYLDKIISPSNNNSIDFIYNQSDTVFFQSDYQVSYTTASPYSGSSFTYGPSISATGYTNYYILPQLLTDITSNNSIVSFTYSSEYSFNRQPVRQDLPRDKYLTSIQVMTSGDCNGHIVKSFLLGHDYFQENGCLLSNCKRLALTSVTESANGTNKPPYIFTYNTNINLPGNDEIQYADYWGYCNGASSNYSGLPPNPYAFIASGTHNGLAIQGSNKAPNANFMQANVLLSVTNPIGGKTSFTYEANSYYDLSSLTNVTVGGLRILQSSTYDGISHEHDIIKDYQYFVEGGGFQSSGSIGAMPQFYYDKNLLVANTGHSYVAAFSEPIVEVPTTNGSHIAYSCVTVSETNKGKTVYKFTDFKDHPDLPSFNSENVSFFPFPNGHPEYTWNQSSRLVLPSTSMEMERGLLLSTSQYDDDGNLQRRATNTYNFNDPNQAVIYGLRVNLFSLFLGYRAFSGGQGCPYGIPSLCIQINATQAVAPLFDYDFSLIPKVEAVSDNPFGYMGYYSVVSKWVQLVSTTEEIFDQSNSGNVGNVIVNSTNFEYYNINLQPSKIKQTNSDGRQLITYIAYPADYVNSGSGSLMYALANTTNELVMEKVMYEITTTGDTYILSGQANVYDNSFRLQSQYSLETASTIPLASFKFSNQSQGILPLVNSSNQTSFQLDSRYTIRLTCDAYDAKDNLMQSHEEKGVPQVSFWGQNYSYPIAVVSGFPYNQLAYSSFECGDALEGNVHSSGGSIVKTSQTGQYSYFGGVISILSLPAGTYKVGFWVKPSTSAATTVSVGGVVMPVAAGGNWQYLERVFTYSSIHTFDLVNNVSPQVYVDEFRLHPVGALMTSYVYQPLVGLSSTTDARKVLTTYQYDTLNRLKLVLDQDGNIRKRYTYNYKQ